MKILKLLSFFAITLLLGCNNNDDDSGHDTTLSGQWKLVEVSGTITGIRDQFAPGTIEWNFNTSDQTFRVVNNNTDANKQDVFESGTYDYSFAANEIAPDLCNRTIVLDGTNYGCFMATTTTLQINQGEADGIIIKLIR